MYLVFILILIGSLREFMDVFLNLLGPQLKWKRGFKMKEVTVVDDPTGGKSYAFALKKGMSKAMHPVVPAYRFNASLTIRDKKLFVSLENGTVVCLGK